MKARGAPDFVFRRFMPDPQKITAGELAEMIDELTAVLPTAVEPGQSGRLEYR